MRSGRFIWITVVLLLISIVVGLVHQVEIVPQLNVKVGLGFVIRARPAQHAVHALDDIHFPLA